MSERVTVSDLTVVVVVCVALTPSASDAQYGPEPIRSAEVWCIQHTPCDHVSHVVMTAGSSVALSAIPGLESEQTRWLPVALYVGKEVHENVFRWPGQIPWHDTALDLVSVAVGAWAAPAIEDLF